MPIVRLSISHPRGTNQNFTENLGKHEAKLFETKLYQTKKTRSLQTSKSTNRPHKLPHFETLLRNNGIPQNQGALTRPTETGPQKRPKHNDLHATCKLRKRQLPRKDSEKRQRRRRANPSRLRICDRKRRNQNLPQKKITNQLNPEIVETYPCRVETFINKKC